MTALHAIFLAVLQGLTELFPVSSLGHAVVVPRLLGWNFNQRGPDFLPFLVVLHLGTATALLAYFWRDWIDLLLALLGRGDPGRRRQDLKLVGLIVIGTLPAVVIGFAFEKWLRALFGTPVIAAIFLIVNGGILFVAERRRRQGGAGELGGLSRRAALGIGFCQCAAFIPGISRSGATMVGGLLAGLRHEAAARFSFLLATPVIAGAGVLEVPKLIHHGPIAAGVGVVALIAGIVAGVTAYLSVAFLMRYFHKHEFEALDPFAYYCIGAGALFLVLLQLGF